MMGLKERNFRPLRRVSLEGLVPRDQFYCHLDVNLDLSFVRDLVRDRYSLIGRPGVDPVVFFGVPVAVRPEEALSRSVC